MKVITAILLMLAPGNYTQPVRVSMQPLALTRGLAGGMHHGLYDPTVPLAKEPQSVEKRQYEIRSLVKGVPALEKTFMLNLKEIQNLSLEDISEDLSIADKSRIFESKAYSQKDKRYVKSNKRSIQSNGGFGTNEESRNLTLCHFKICNMGRKRTTRFYRVVSSSNNDN